MRTLRAGRKEPPPRKGFLARAQFEHLLSKLPANLRPLVTLLYYCGVRAGEATRIEWSQVDLRAAWIRLDGEIVIALWMQQTL